MSDKLPKDIRQEIASARRDIFIPYFGQVMRPQDDVLAAKGGHKGLKIYAEIERDAHVLAVLDKRIGAVVARSWEVQPGGPSRQDRKAAELAERVLAGEWGFSYDRVCREQLDAILKGFAIGEIMWKREDGFITPADVKPKEQRRFVFTVDGDPRLLTMQDLSEGEAVPDRKFLVHRHGDKVGDPYGLGLGHQLFWPTWFKREGITFWLVFCEKFGAPTPVGKYPRGTPEDEQREILSTLAGLAQESAIVVPDGTLVEYLEAMRSGDGSYEKLVRYMDEQISEAVLGETLTTNIGSSGSRAASETHNGVREEKTDGDCDVLSGSHNAQLWTWLTELNYPDARPPKVWRPRPAREKEEAETDKAKAEARLAQLAFVSKMRSEGWKPTDEKADLSHQFDGGWAFVGRAAPPAPATTPDPSREFAEAKTKPRDFADDLADQMRQAAAPAMDGIVGQVRAVIDSCDTLEDVAERLAAEYGAIDTGDLARIMAEAMTAGHLAGMAEMVDGES